MLHNLRKGERRTVHLYFAPKGGPPKPPSLIYPPPLPRLFQDFERLLPEMLPAYGLGRRPFEGWALSTHGEGNEAKVVERKDARSGRRALLLSVPEGKGYALLSSSLLKVEPDSRYRVSFWAKTLEGDGLVRINFYGGPKFDFQQVPVDLVDDGRWHRYEVEVPTGAFPEGVSPYFRLWAIGRPQKVLVDDITVEPVRPPAPPLRVEVLGVERLGTDLNPFSTAIRSTPFSYSPNAFSLRSEAPESGV